MVTAAEERKCNERDSATTEVLEAAMNTLKRPRSDSEIRDFKSPRKSVRQASARIVDILEHQLSAKIDSTDLQRKRLELDERRIAFEEQRLTLDREKHLADVEEKRAQTSAYHAQTQLMLQRLSAMNANNKKAT
ncbi:TPA: hypothetical protein N0F65_005858 [Lagenidium giganteum]|uniref:Uncharacterized protein n=1 Tax=Lagenidium giganteum TaxID=4803 RepID=A0AAV2YM62_9STRA|nr:TPA: hypothetical protein N0F65_005858 [Lagenidium giganteum]